MILSYSKKRSCFYCRPSFDERHLPRKAGFEFVADAKAWVTSSPYVAFTLKDFADDEVRRMFEPMAATYEASWATASAFMPPVPDGCELLPYQRAGVWFALEGFSKRKSTLIADPMGLGKTVQAIATANALQLEGKSVLVICPASLRLNWKRELDKWSTMKGGPAEVVLSGKDTPPRKGPLVISYTLAATEAWAECLSWWHWDLIIFDEAHYLKSRDAGRTKELLGNRETPGLVSRAKRVMLLTGTPVPNRPHEFFWPIKRLAPEVIDHMGWYAFCRRFVEGFEDITGFRATGVRHEQEMHNRLRGSGWMVRRRKEDVLPQLPQKRYSLVVFPQDAKTAKVVAQERQFDARQIIEHGVPVGVAALPELRKEMGLAKVKTCVSWIRDVLDGGVDKLLVFAHHAEVIEQVAAGLQEYRPAVIYGKTPMGARQERVDAFQSDPEARVLVGSFQPMGVGWTLTAAHDVVFVEASWVPSDNEQALDRAHRIGQEAESVNIYYLVVESSLDAKILGEAAKKESDIRKVLG